MSDQFVTDWVIRTVREQYPDDIALVISHTTLRIQEKETCISYFVPITSRGEQFARTFILAGTGYDIWGISWERLEGFADLAEYNLTCLADGEVLYARTRQDEERFHALQAKLAENLADNGRMRTCALQAYQEARQIYLEMLFASGSDVKLGAGYVLDYLARAVAFTNHHYFRRAQTDQLRELQDMDRVPEGFPALYTSTLFEKEEEAQKKDCYRLICLTQQFLADQQPDASPGTGNVPSQEHNYQDLADWYGELAYTWLRIRHYTDRQDPVKVYMWGIYLQSELNQVCRDFGLEKIELMQCFDKDNLLPFAARTAEAEDWIRDVITTGGGIIHAYADEKEFLDEV